MNEAATSAGVRFDWLELIVGQSQNVTGKVLVADPEEARVVLEMFLGTLPPPANQAERLVLRGFFLEFASRTGTMLHAQAHQGVRDVPCRLVPELLMARFWSVPADSPQDAFRRWIAEFFRQFRETHPPSAAARVAKLIRQKYGHTWTATSLASRVHTTPSHLARHFLREFGMSVSDYQRRARVAVGLERVLRQRVDAATRGVGFRSKKNFYRAVQQLTGLTLAEFRRLSETRATEIIDTLRLSLLGHRAKTHPAIRGTADRRIERVAAADRITRRMGK